MAKPNPSLRQFFNTLNLSAFPTDIQQAINTIILPSPDLDNLPADDEHYMAVVELVNEKFPAALVNTTPSKKQENPVPESVVETEIPSSSETTMPSKAVLLQQEKLIKKLIAKEPENKVFNQQLKLITKMLKSVQ